MQLSQCREPNVRTNKKQTQFLPQKSMIAEKANVSWLGAHNAKQITIAKSDLNIKKYNSRKSSEQQNSS